MHLEEGLIHACFQATEKISAANDKLLVLVLYNGKGHTSLSFHVTIEIL